MKLEAEEQLRRTGAAVRWRTCSREVKELRPVSMSFTLEESTPSLTLKRTTCSIGVVCVDMLTEKGLKEGRWFGRRRRCLELEGSMEIVRSASDSILSPKVK